MGRVIYCDTDSRSDLCPKRNESLLLHAGNHTGNCMGQLTNEIENGWKMHILIGMGANNYRYSINIYLQVKWGTCTKLEK